MQLGHVQYIGQLVYLRFRAQLSKQEIGILEHAWAYHSLGLIKFRDFRLQSGEMNGFVLHH